MDGSLDDPVVSHPFSHPGQHLERLAAYRGESFGGPANHTTSMGDHTHVLRMHADKGEHADRDSRAVALLDAAMADVPVPEKTRWTRPSDGCARAASGVRRGR